MSIQRFEQIIAWQKSQDFAVIIYQTFFNSKDYGFKDQICRASVSISNNIAEGFDRSSNSEFVRFLYYSLGSSSEAKSMLYLAERLKYVSPQNAIELRFQASELSRIITGLIKSMK